MVHETLSCEERFISLQRCTRRSAGYVIESVASMTSNGCNFQTGATMGSKRRFSIWCLGIAAALFIAAEILGSPWVVAAQAPATQAQPQAGRPGARPGNPQRRPGNQPGRPGNQPGRPTAGRPGRPTIQPVPGPRPTPGRPGYRPPRPGPGRPGGPPPPYAWRPGDRDRMARYYRRNFGYINRGRRPIFTIGGFIPFGDRSYFRPVPPGLYGYMPPPPPGYVMGYFDGYVVVYDPVSFTILSTMDLLD
jgi:hypothetical protein